MVFNILVGSDAKYLSNEVLKYILKYIFGTKILVLKYYFKEVLSTYILKYHTLELNTSGFKYLHTYLTFSDWL